MIVFALLLVHGGSYLADIVFAAIFVGVLLPAVWSGNPTRRTAATSIIRLFLSLRFAESEGSSETNGERDEN
jgi:hypothetical protein